jgi:hypothetical protein
MSHPTYKPIAKPKPGDIWAAQPHPTAIYDEALILWVRTTPQINGETWTAQLGHGVTISSYDQPRHPREWHPRGYFDAHTEPSAQPKPKPTTQEKPAPKRRSRRGSKTKAGSAEAVAGQLANGPAAIQDGAA